MLKQILCVTACCSIAVFLNACSTTRSADNNYSSISSKQTEELEIEPAKSRPDYAMRLPQHINTRERTILVDPNVHAWGAYDANGNLIRAGLATAGDDWCEDIGRPCRTKAGTFRIFSLGSESCKSSIYPLPKGGAPMPYCMFFNGNQGLHGSPWAVEGNVSHGCVRMKVNDAEWVRFQFARPGTKVIVRPY